MEVHIIAQDANGNILYRLPLKCGRIGGKGPCAQTCQFFMFESDLTDKGQATTGTLAFCAHMDHPDYSAYFPGAPLGRWFGPRGHSKPIGETW